MPTRNDSPHAAIDRARTLAFQFDGRTLTGHPGDTLASALLANGVGTVARSPYLGRPRGIVSAGVEEPNALVEVAADAHVDPMARATTVELFDGLRARSLAGRGRVGAPGGAPRCDKRHHHCDVLVVGGGLAGLSAAVASAHAGARVLLVDERPQLGGTTADHAAAERRADAAAWVERASALLAAGEETVVLTRATAIGLFDHGFAVVAERRVGDDGALLHERLWHVRARRVVLATGAIERPLVFAGNDRPGVMLAGAARVYANRFAVSPGSRAVVFTTDDGAYDAAADLLARGVEVPLLVDGRATAPPQRAARLRAQGTEVLAGAAVAATRGGERLAGVAVAPLAADGRLAGGARELACDLLAVSGGWTPTLQLFAQAGGELRWEPSLAAHLPQGTHPALAVAGWASGATSAAAAIEQGARAGAAAAAACGFAAADAPAAGPLPALDAAADPELPPRALWSVPPLPGESWEEHFVDLQRDATVAHVRRALDAGLHSPEHVKRYTTIGTGEDQGKTANVNALGIVAELLGTPIAQLAQTTYRPPYAPVPFGLLAGRDRGPLHDPVRTTPIHAWHERAGAVFEHVGQWLRPRYYPQAGEDMERAMLRECRVARERVAVVDASTLGKIDVQGPDAGELLDRVYTNAMSTLPVGGCRYGVLCKTDGMVFDDGVVMRLAADRFVMTTTTGGAAAVFDWLEEWLQTEWPDLRVWLTSVTDHWAAIAVVGPDSRAVVAALAPGVPLDAERFPFMTIREATVAGVPARLCRVSFSGELAYEIHVPARHALGTWEAVMDAGRDHGIEPYGLEALHVLRAEKGYVAVGQDSDGTATPQDLGMGWIVSKRKDFFLGRRSHRRPAMLAADRRQLVGLLPDDPQELLPEGAQLLRADGDRTRTAGHVTSSYRSAALGRSFALALLERGGERSGETVRVAYRGRETSARVTGTVFFDPEGSRRDGAPT